MDYKEKVLKQLGDLSKERINEVIDFIGYLKSKDARRGRNRKIDLLDTKGQRFINFPDFSQVNKCIKLL
jgi:hypothetical protein